MFRLGADCFISRQTLTMYLSRLCVGPFVSLRHSHCRLLTIQNTEKDKENQGQKKKDRFRVP